MKYNDVKRFTTITIPGEVYTICGYPVSTAQLLTAVDYL